MARPELSDRETEVLRLIANGRDNAEIAQELHISPKTVKNHISNILMKLQIENRIQAAVYAVRSGLVGDFRFGRFAAKRGEALEGGEITLRARQAPGGVGSSFACCSLLPWSSSAASVPIERSRRALRVELQRPGVAVRECLLERARGIAAALEQVQELFQAASEGCERL